MATSAAIAILVVTVSLLGCRSKLDQQQRAPAAPAEVENPRREGDLTTLTLTPEAEKHLGISTAPVDFRPVRRTRTLGGEVVIPAGSRGYGDEPAFVLRSHASAADRARAAEALVTAEGEVNRAKVEAEAATVALGRAERMLRDGVGTARAADEARADLSVARAKLNEAENRREVLAKETFRVPEIVWLRVPVYIGDLEKIEAGKDAVVGSLAGTPGAAKRMAKPVSGFPSANPEAATVDLFYEMENRDAALRTGEKVGVTIELRDEERSLVVPWSAVVHDIHGGEWVYENVAPHVFARQRVQVLYVTGTVAALASGPKPGAPVVVEGAAELFGTEFGVGK